MKELCIDVRMALSAGIGTYIRNIVPLLAESFKLRLITNEAVIEKWPFLNKCDLIETSVPIYSIEEQIKLPFLIPSCDLFWTPHYNVPFLGLRAKKRIVTIHDVYHLAFQHALSYPQRIYAKIMLSRATKVSDHVFTISQFSKDEIIKHTGVAPDKVSVVHLAVDRSQFSPSPASKDIKKLSFPYFLFVSTLSPHKNIERLILAWNLVRQKFPQWKLVLVGKAGKKESWREVIDRNPALEKSLLFLGQVEDQYLPGLYRGAHATIHPSLYEGFGLTPLEAMSSGCPSIVSKAASLPEVCGDSSLYVDPYDVHDIAAGMEKMIEDPNLHQELKNKGLQRSNIFSWKTTAEKHIAVMGKFV